MPARERHEHRRREREQHVHRQHRREIGLALEGQQLGCARERRREHHADVVEREVRRIDPVVVEHGRHDEHQRRGREKRAVDLHRAAHEALLRGARAVPFGDRAIRARGREAAEKDEDLGRIAQRERVQRDARQHARADVIDDDHQQHDAAEEIDFDQAAAARRRKRGRRRRANDMAPARRRCGTHRRMDRGEAGERDRRRYAYARIAPTRPVRHGDDRSLKGCIRREVGKASLMADPGRP